MLDVVKASLTGSIIGNLLLVLGAAFLAGGLQTPRPDLRHHRRAHPGRHDGARGDRHHRALRVRHDRGGKFVAQSVTFSVVVSVVLLAVYVLSLVFTLGTHAQLFRG